VRCEQAVPQLWLFLDGELGPAASRVLLAHLRACPRCRDEATARWRLKLLLRRAFHPTPAPPTLQRRLRTWLGWGAPQAVRISWSGERWSPRSGRAIARKRCG